MANSIRWKPCEHPFGKMVLPPHQHCFAVVTGVSIFIIASKKKKTFLKKGEYQHQSTSQPDPFLAKSRSEYKRGFDVMRRQVPITNVDSFPPCKENSTPIPHVLIILAVLSLLTKKNDASLTSSTTNVNGVVEIVLYIAIRLYGLSMTCLRVAMCFKILFGNTIDAGIAWFVRKKLNEAFRPPNLVKLIHLIRDALFFDPPSPRTKMDRLARESDIRDKVIHLLPKWMKKLFFVPELYIEGANTLVNSFQHPVLNKQLSYMLLDIILEELFPELRKREESDDTQYLSFLNRSSYVATS
ncbi:Sorting nexin-14 [Armadillidium vulgare]|nr:Sorting nexin-14 [Armadillidium vulgare]